MPKTDELILRGEILERVVHLGYWMSTWTGFVLEIDAKQYLFSAKHCFMGNPNGFNFMVTKGKVSIESANWVFVEHLLEPIYPDDNNSDLVAFAMESGKEIAPMIWKITYGWGANVTLTEDVWFAGFPLNLKTEVVGGRPLPIVKKWMIAGFPSASSAYVDAMSNPWFSGGPVFKKIPLDDWSYGIHIVGLVSSRINDFGNQNSGIMQIWHLDDLIEKIKRMHLSQELSTNVALSVT